MAESADAAQAPAKAPSLTEGLQSVNDKVDRLATSLADAVATLGELKSEFEAFQKQVVGPGDLSVLQRIEQRVEQLYGRVGDGTPATAPAAAPAAA